MWGFSKAHFCDTVKFGLVIRDNFPLLFSVHLFLEFFELSSNIIRVITQKTKKIK